MDSFWQHSTKYDGSLHYRYPVGLVERSEGRLVTYSGPGDLVESYRGSRVGEKHLLSFFWRERPFVLHVRWDRDWKAEILYVDIATGTNWNEGTVGYVDMDLDLILRHGSAVVELDDEDEFEEHRTRRSYPAELVEDCWKAVEEVRRLLEAGKEPFAVSMFAWRPGAVLNP